MQKSDIIIFTLLRSDLPYSSTPLSLAKEFSKETRVFYINFPFTWSDAVKSKNTRNFSIKEEQLSDNLIVVNTPNILPVNFLSEKNYDRINVINQKTIEKTLNQTIKKHNINQYIYINCFTPFLMPISTAKLNPLKNIYYCVDEIAGEAYIAKHGVRLEKIAAKKADITLNTSFNLLEKQTKITKKAFLLANAADTSNFERVFSEQFEKPKAIKNITNQIIGFVGNLDANRIDYGLLKNIADKHTDKTLVLIGPQSSEKYKEFGLDHLKNVIFTGSVALENLPNYFQYFDCAIIPFAKNEQTKSIYPLKINEYLAAGLPVVTTNFSLDIASFSDIAFLAENNAEFVENINTAIAQKKDENLIQKRISRARENTWGERTKQFWKIIEENQ